MRPKKGFSAVPADSQAIRTYPEVRETVVRVPDGWTAQGYADSLLGSGRYDYVCLNPVVRPCRRPDDPRFPYQWHHTTMQSERAWDIRSGLSSDVVVGLVDTGVDLTHPDLAPNLVSGWDMVSDKSQANGGDVQDDEGHGTAMAGLIAAKGNNGLGVAGMGWGLKVMPIKVIDGATLDQLLAGARKAADLGCKVVNVSYEGVAQVAVETTGQYCKTKEALLVYSAGNNGANLSFDYPNVIVVGASNQQDQLLAGSAFGNGVDLVAPGSTILSTARYGKYDYTGGTSASAAITSGVAAMMRWINPYMTWETWSNNLVRGTVDLGLEGKDSTYGWGRLDTYHATKRVVPLQSEIITPPSDTNNIRIEGSNNLGQVVGSRGSSDGPRAFIASTDRGFLSLSPLAGHNCSDAYCVDSAGNVYGISYLDYPAKASHAVKWPAGQSVPVILPRPMDDNYHMFYPCDVNDAGDIVGPAGYYESHPIYGTYLAFRYALIRNGQFIDLPHEEFDTFSGLPFWIRVNQSGWISGYSYSSAGGMYSLLWDPNLNFTREFFGAFDLGKHGELIGYHDNIGAVKAAGVVRYALPAPGYDNCILESINDDGQMYGYYGATFAPMIFNELRGELLSRLVIGFPDNREIGRITSINGHGELACQISAPYPDNDFRLAFLRPLYNQGQGGLTVNCGLILGDYPGDPYKVPVTLKLYQNGVLKETIPNLVPGSNGYRFTTLLRGTFTVMVSAPHFLTKKVANVTIEDGFVAGLTASLVNGDVDNDNVIGLFDYLALSEAFDSQSDVDGDAETEDPSPNWNPKADLDGDETISLFDYLTLSANFDQTGDTL